MHKGKEYYKIFSVNSRYFSVKRIMISWQRYNFNRLMSFLSRADRATSDFYNDKLTMSKFAIYSGEIFYYESLILIFYL